MRSSRQRFSSLASSIPYKARLRLASGWDSSRKEFLRDPANIKGTVSRPGAWGA
jgi:hypothetical protein